MKIFFPIAVKIFVINEFDNDDEFKCNDIFNVELYCYKFNLGGFYIQKSKPIKKQLDETF